MSESYGPGREVVVQRKVARIALASVDGFALAGSGAIREHGIIQRPTEDVDLFTASQDVPAFAVAVEEVIAGLQGSGFLVEQTRRAPQYARLHVTAEDRLELDVDLGVDWRQDDPVTLHVGPVLSLADAVGSKVGALYSRAEARDYLDVDAIRASGRFSDDELLAGAAERDPGFDVAMFARQLGGARQLGVEDVARYGFTADQLEALKTRCTQWAADLAQQPETTSAAGISSEELQHLAALREAAFPSPATEAVRQQPGPPDHPPERRPGPRLEREPRDWGTEL